MLMEDRTVTFDTDFSIAERWKFLNSSLASVHQNLSINCNMCCCSASLHSESPASPRFPAYSNKKNCMHYAMII